MKWRAIEVRLLTFYCLLLLVLGGIFSAFTVRSFSHFERETLRRVVAARASEIWAVGSASINEPLQLRDLIERRFSPGTQDRFIRIIVDGVVLYQSDLPRSLRGEISLSALSVKPNAEQIHEFGEFLILSRSFRTTDGRSIQIDSGQSDRFAEVIRSSLVSSLVLGLPTMLAFAALGGYFLIRQAWAPLGLMIRAAEAITFNDPHNRLPLTGTGDRIEILGQSLNRMLDRLDSAYQHASRFSADAAHEIRTPLAIIRGELEFIADHPELPHDIQKSVGSIMEESKRLADMSENLLTLARMDSVWGKREHTPVDLSALATETIDQMNLLADEKQIRLTDPRGPDTRVFGDRNRLKQVLVNLLDNAIKYTPDGGIVEVEIRPHESRVQLLVRDSGIGIPADHMEDIFHRFYRISPGRGPNGAGLGLAIARSICQAHGGTLTARSLEGVGSEFCVDLPIASS